MTIEPTHPVAGDLLPTLRGNTRNAVASLCDYLAHIEDQVLNSLARSVSEAIHAEHLYVTERGQFVEYLEPVEITPSRRAELVEESERRLGEMARDPLAVRWARIEEALLVLSRSWIHPSETEPPKLTDLQLCHVGIDSDDGSEMVCVDMAFFTGEHWEYTGCNALRVAGEIIGYLPFPEGSRA